MKLEERNLELYSVNMYLRVDYHLQYIPLAAINKVVQYLGSYMMDKGISMAREENFKASSWNRIREESIEKGEKFYPWLKERFSQW